MAEQHTGNGQDGVALATDRMVLLWQRDRQISWPIILMWLKSVLSCIVEGRGINVATLPLLFMMHAKASY